MNLSSILATLLCFVSAARAADVNLAWDPVDVAASYTLYYSSDGKQTFQSVPGIVSSAVSVTNLTVGTAYAFFVTDTDADGNESPYSNEYDYTPASSSATPTPTPTPTPSATPTPTPTPTPAPVETPVVTVDPSITVRTVAGARQGTATFLLSAPATQSIDVSYCLYGTANDGHTYFLIYTHATIPAGVMESTVDIVAPTAAYPKFYSRLAYFVLSDDNGSYQATFKTLPITTR